MSEPIITVSILSWLLEDRLIETLKQIPRTTSMPLNLCLHVQASEQISRSKRQEILDATSRFSIRDIFFTKGNAGAARPRAALMKRSAITPYVFVTDNDMVFQPGSIDRLYKFLSNPDNSNFGMVDLVHNYLRWHRRVDGTEVTCIPLDFDTQDVVEVDLIGAASLFMRREVALLPNLIDPSYSIGTWDFDMCLNIKNAGWKIATIVDKSLIALNDKTHRFRGYKAGRVNNRLRVEGTKIFERKWGFSSEHYPNSPKKVSEPKPELSPADERVLIISRAIYTELGDTPAIGVLDPHRIEMMQRYFINSLRNQTDKNFTLYMIVGSASNETVSKIKLLDWGNLDVRFIYIDDDLSTWKKSVEESENWGREIDEGCPEVLAANCNHPTTSIMARLDIDDWVAPGWVAHMRYMAETKSESHFLINYRVISQGPDGKLYRFFAPHNRGRTSPFIAIVQKTEPRISPYKDTHLNMGKRFSKVYTVSPSYAFMVCHGGNRSNRIYKPDRCFGNFEDTWEENPSKRVVKISKPIVEPKPVPKSRPTVVPQTDWRSRINQSSFKK